MPNHFDLLNLPASYAIDTSLLEQHYRKLQAEVHPDRFVTASPSERLQSMQIATQANEAYLTLKKPSARARYLLQLKGIDTQEESNTAMPADFLMQQMEWREMAEDAKADQDIGSLENLLKDMRKTAQSLESALHQYLDEQNDLQAAAQSVRKLSFIEKISEDIKNTIEAIEDSIA